MGYRVPEDRFEFKYHKKVKRDKLVPECPCCHARFKSDVALIDLIVVDGRVLPVLHCSQCEEVFSTRTATLRKVAKYFGHDGTLPDVQLTAQEAVNEYKRTESPTEQVRRRVVKFELKV